MQILTPAKINPILYILGKLKNGYHKLFMHMVPISLYDILKFSKNNSEELNFRINGTSYLFEQEENLVIKAIRLFEKKTGKNVFLDIILEKNIPIGAGLGGGSGNAAGTLCVLNYLFRESYESDGILSPDQLFDIALELGSDVPFFLKPLPSKILGRGEKLIPLKNYPKFFVLLIKPSFSISTSDAYKECIFKEKSTFPKINSLDDLKIHMSNEFENSLFNQFPILAEMKSLLFKNGAFGALVSGSGSTVFGAFKEKNQQNQAFKDISCLDIGELFSCETLACHCYF